MTGGFAGWPSGPIHLAPGVFDGVHLGHRDLVARLAAGARAAGAHAVVATFEPLPDRFFDPKNAPPELLDTTDRLRLLREAGAEAVILLHFGRALADLTPEQFVERLRGAGDVRHIVVGADYRFGRKREGDVEALRALGARHGFSVEPVEHVRSGGEVVSSTRIRQLLAEGVLEGVRPLLGRQYFVRGTVVGGDSRGTALGYPTANVRVSPERCLPRDGIYATWFEVQGARHAAATSLGVRPTFGVDLDRRLEAFVLDFSGNLYGQEAKVTFVKRLRDELRFDGADDLVAQIAKDVSATREALALDAPA